MDNRPTIQQYLMQIALTVATRATCSRRQVGCVLVNSYNHIIATGYNGVARGQPHCISNPCLGTKFESGKGLEFCEAIHAEQNALLQCSDVNKISAVYCTTKPCITCTKLLLNTSANIIYYADDYAHEDADRLWTRSGKRYKRIKV